MIFVRRFETSMLSKMLANFMRVEESCEAGFEESTIYVLFFNNYKNF